MQINSVQSANFNNRPAFKAHHITKAAGEYLKTSKPLVTFENLKKNTKSSS